MIESRINTILPLTANDSSVTFQNDYRTGSTCGCNSWLCHQEGSANYDIVKGGLYDIDLTMTVSSAAAGDVAIALFNNGEIIPGSLRVVSLAAADDFADISVSTTLRVCCNANSNISVRSVPAVQTPSTPTTPITTQVPIIISSILSISREC